MKELHVNEEEKEVAGESFEDLSQSEMTEVQGAGDIEGETIAVSVAATIAASKIVGAASGSLIVGQTIKNIF